jgi:hypothetical protein
MADYWRMFTNRGAATAYLHQPGAERPEANGMPLAPGQTIRIGYRTRAEFDAADVILATCRAGETTQIEWTEYIGKE